MANTDGVCKDTAHILGGEQWDPRMLFILRGKVKEEYSFVFSMSVDLAKQFFKCVCIPFVSHSCAKMVSVCFYFNPAELHGDTELRF